jgi:hypothetical protein
MELLRDRDFVLWVIAISLIVGVSELMAIRRILGKKLQ